MRLPIRCDTDVKVLLSTMPTTRPRHVITETDEIAKVLDDAAERWPEDRSNRRRLLYRLLIEGHSSAMQESAAERAMRRAAIERTRGALSGIYREGYLADLRQDWPE